MMNYTLAAFTAFVGACLDSVLKLKPCWTKIYVENSVHT